jgi:FMN phosphatase YigB (HAD superfamily)
VNHVTDLSLILFDLNGVLYRYDRAARISWIATAAQRSPEAVLSAVWESGFEDLGDAGTLDEAGYLRGFGDRIGYPITEDAWLTAQRVAVTPIAATLALVGRVRGRARCAVLTNNNLLVLRHFSTIYPEVASLVGEAAFVSAEFAARKPDPDAYRCCLGRLGVLAASVLFVDDSAANVAGALEAGLQGYVYTGSDELEAELRRRGVLD